MHHLTQRKTLAYLETTNSPKFLRFYFIHVSLFYEFYQTICHRCRVATVNVATEYSFTIQKNKMYNSVNKMLALISAQFYLLQISFLIVL